MQNALLINKAFCTKIKAFFTRSELVYINNTLSKILARFDNAPTLRYNANLYSQNMLLMIFAEYLFQKGGNLKLS